MALFPENDPEFLPFIELKAFYLWPLSLSNHLPYLSLVPNGWSLFFSFGFIFPLFLSLSILHSYPILLFSSSSGFFFVIPSMFWISLSPLSVRLMTFCSVTCVHSGPWSRPWSCWRAQEQGRRKERWRVAGRKRQRSRSLSPSPLRLHLLPGKYGIWLAQVCCTFSVWWCCLWPTAGVNLNNMCTLKHTNNTIISFIV